MNGGFWGGAYRTHTLRNTGMADKHLHPRVLKFAVRTQVCLAIFTVVCIGICYTQTQTTRGSFQLDFFDADTLMLRTFYCTVEGNRHIVLCILYINL